MCISTDALPTMEAKHIFFFSRFTSDSCAWLQKNTYVYTYVYVHIRTLIYLCIYTCMYMYMNTYVYVYRCLAHHGSARSFLDSHPSREFGFIYLDYCCSLTVGKHRIEKSPIGDIRTLFRLGKKDTHAYTHTHTLAHTHAHTLTHSHAHSRAHKKTHTKNNTHILSTHTHTHTTRTCIPYIRTHAHTRTHTHAHTHTCTHTHTHTPTHSHPHACTHKRTHAKNNIHILTHTLSSSFSLALSPASFLSVSLSPSHTHTHTNLKALLATFPLCFASVSWVQYRVAMNRRLLKITGLFCRISSLL